MTRFLPRLALLAALSSATVLGASAAQAQSRTMVGVGAGAVAGALVAGPIGAVVGGVVGAAWGESGRGHRRAGRRCGATMRCGSPPPGRCGSRSGRLPRRRPGRAPGSIRAEAPVPPSSLASGPEAPTSTSIQNAASIHFRAPDES